MKLNLFLIGFMALAKGISAEPCKGSAVPARVQKGEVLKARVQKPAALAIDRNTNTLFFSYTVDDLKRSTMYLNLNNGTYSTVRKVYSFTHAVDNLKNIVYIGTGTGIYQFDYATKRSMKLNITDKLVDYMFFKDGLYFNSFPGMETYFYKDGVVNLMPQLKGCRVAADKNNDIIFYQDGTLKKVVNETIVRLGDFEGPFDFNADAEGNLYFASNRTIYKFVDGEIKKLMSIDKMRSGFAVEGDGAILYAGDSNVVRLRPAPFTTICVDEDQFWDRGPYFPEWTMSQGEINTNVATPQTIVTYL